MLQREKEELIIIIIIIQLVEISTALYASDVFFLVHKSQRFVLFEIEENEIFRNVACIGDKKYIPSLTREIRKNDTTLET
jgi:hypothetical protein